jgi:hypothetical protein
MARLFWTDPKRGNTVYSAPQDFQLKKEAQATLKKVDVAIGSLSSESLPHPLSVKSVLDSDKRSRNHNRC